MAFVSVHSCSLVIILSSNFLADVAYNVGGINDASKPTRKKCLRRLCYLANKERPFFTLDIVGLSPPLILRQDLAILATN